jgi:hypothetical protein
MHDSELGLPHDIAIKWDFFSKFFEWGTPIRIRGQERSRIRIAISLVEGNRNVYNLNKKIFPFTKLEGSKEHGA